MRPTKPGLYFWRYLCGDQYKVVIRQVVSVKVIGKDGNKLDALVFNHEGEQFPVCLTDINDWFYVDQDCGDWVDGTNIEIGDYIAGYGKISSHTELLILKRLGRKIQSDDNDNMAAKKVEIMEHLMACGRI